jgi:sugar lactone lactonase YvrE
VNGSLADKRLFTGSDPRGAPDGSRLDGEHVLWNCRIACGAGIIRYSREGSLTGFIDLPCSWPTSCAFGGTQFDELYVTSARFTMSADHLRRHPEEGALSSVDGGQRIQFRLGRLDEAAIIRASNGSELARRRSA